jgi:hypothetical protein
VLVNSGSDEGRSRAYSIPYDVFEQAVLSCLQEIDPHDILNGDQGPDETVALAGELASVEEKIAELEAELLNGDVAALARVLRALEDKRRDVAERLNDARQRAAHPLSETWGEAKTLFTALRSASDPRDARLRIRSALRRMVDSISLLVVPRGHNRLCAVQLWFAEGRRHRDYLILHRPAYNNGTINRPASMDVRSFADAEIPILDLRNPKSVSRLEAALLALPLTLPEN